LRFWNFCSQSGLQFFFLMSYWIFSH
jgi:hypothetical protein